MGDGSPRAKSPGKKRTRTPRPGAVPGTGKDGVAVVGLGNVLMGDDALGPYVIKVLEAVYAFPEDVALIDAGTPGHDLILYLSGRRAVIVVDAVRAPGRPGDVRLYGEREIMAAPPSPAAGCHEPGLKGALLRLRLAGGIPAAIALIGVVPERLGPVPGLSAAVRAAVPRVAEEVLRILSRLGVRVPVRSPAGAPDLWWERSRE